MLIMSGMGDEEKKLIEQRIRTHDIADPGR